MRTRIVRTLMLVMACLQVGGWGLAQSKSPPTGAKSDYGTLVVSAKWDDTRHTAATNVYIEAHGFVRGLGASHSYQLLPTESGRYEAKVPPAVYDVFISDGISIPVCKRVQVEAHRTVSWMVQLQTDLEYTLK
jgi:hypothetical protein